MKLNKEYIPMKFIFLLGLLTFSNRVLADVQVSQPSIIDDPNIQNHTIELDTRIVSDNGNIRFEDAHPNRFGGDNIEKENYVDGFIRRGISRLGIHLERVIADKTITKLDSIVISPTSIGSLLALVLLGSAGKTFVEVANVLGLTAGVDISENTDYVHKEFGKLLAMMISATGLETTYGGSLNNSSGLLPSTSIAVQGTAFASAVFLQNGYPVHARFIQNTQKLYRSQVLSLDFSQKSEEAKDAINRWVEQKTMGRIPQFLSEPPSPNTKVLLATALYFNGEWEQHFPIESTRVRNWNSGQSKSRVWMMSNAGNYPYGISSRLNATIVAIPYRGRAMSMYFVLPNEYGEERLNNFMKGLSVNDLEELANNLNDTDMIISIPRFKIETTKSLKEPLQHLGLTTLFDPEKADLSFISPGDRGFGASTQERLLFKSRIGEMSTNNKSSTKHKRQANPGLYADDVIHKVELEVTETGTVASAATAISITRDGSRSRFIADRPFLFFIRHEETGLILFWGRLLQPNLA